MEIYFALLIPLFACGVCYKLFKQFMTLWEYVSIFVVVLITILIFKGISMNSLTTDRDYVSSNIKSIEYNEPYQTYVTEICTRTYKCGKSTCTETYDCSHCDDYEAEYYMIDFNNNKYSISKSEYDILHKRWNSKDNFVELNRDIEYHNGLFSKCGYDGNRYVKDWDNNIYTVQTITTESNYTNPIRAAHSSFDYREISMEEKTEKKLCDYPEINDFMYQSCVIGVTNDSVTRMFDYLNGKLGQENRFKFFLIFTNNKPLSYALDQEAYWENGNDNEVVIIIDSDNNGKLNWTRAFSWCKNKRLEVDLREDIMENNVLDYNHIYTVLDKTIPKYMTITDFNKEYSYLEVDTPMWMIITTYIISLVVSVGMSMFCVKNEFNENY